MGCLSLVKEALYPLVFTAKLKPPPLRLPAIRPLLVELNVVNEAFFICLCLSSRDPINQHLNP